MVYAFGYHLHILIADLDIGRYEIDEWLFAGHAINIDI